MYATPPFCIGFYGPCVVLITPPPPLLAKKMPGALTLPHITAPFAAKSYQTNISWLQNIVMNKTILHKQSQPLLYITIGSQTSCTLTPKYCSQQNNGQTPSVSIPNSPQTEWPWPLDRSSVRDQIELLPIEDNRSAMHHSFKVMDTLSTMYEIYQLSSKQADEKYVSPGLTFFLLLFASTSDPAQPEAFIKAPFSWSPAP